MPLPGVGQESAGDRLEAFLAQDQAIVWTNGALQARVRSPAGRATAVSRRHRLVRA